MVILKMIKSWAIAIGLFIVGGFLALAWGKRKQKADDQIKAANEIATEVSNVVEISNAVRSNVAKRPRAGADSAIDELRRDWEVPTN